jgi:hypothetical protein
LFHVSRWLRKWWWNAEAVSQHRGALLLLLLLHAHICRCCSRVAARLSVSKQRGDQGIVLQLRVIVFEMLGSRVQRR